MLRTFRRWTCAALLAGFVLSASVASATEPNCPHCRDTGHGHPDLFHNYWVPAGCGQVGAQLYVAPTDVPPVVGHTYITYQPLMPHELLYQHHHTYYRYYDGGRGMTRAKVVYYAPPLQTGIVNLRNHLRLPR
jgi:hypothetical protein